MKTTTYLRHLPIFLEEFDSKPILYILHAIGINRWKIGITNNIKNRWYSIQSQSPVNVTVYKIFICDSRSKAKKLEFNFMQQNENRFVKGEWFECDLADIFELEDTILDYEYCHYIDRDILNDTYEKNNLKDEKRVQNVNA